jgi:hypothetical protein
LTRGSMTTTGSAEACAVDWARTHETTVRNVPTGGRAKPVSWRVMFSWRYHRVVWWLFSEPKEKVVLHLQDLYSETPDHRTTNFPAFYGTRRLVTEFTIVFNFTLPWARTIQYTPSHTISPPTFVLVFLVVSFSLAFPPITYTLSSPSSFVLHSQRISSSLTWSF